VNFTSPRHLGGKIGNLFQVLVAPGRLIWLYAGVSRRSAVRQSIRHDQKTRGAQAVAATRASVGPAMLTTLILSVFLGLLLTGAGWMQLT
jgi:hypothetical protein